MIAVAAAIMVVAAGTILGTRALTSGQEPSTRVEVRATGPSGQQGPVDVHVPNYPKNPGPAVVKGPFRILPYGHEDAPGSAPARSEPPCGTAEAGLDISALIRASDLYVTVGYIPAGFTYQPPTTDYLCGREVRGIVWRFPKHGTANEIIILRSRPRLPVDVRVPPVDSWVALEEASVRGAPAIFLRSKPGQAGGQELSFVSGGIYTRIEGGVADFGELIKVAESLR
ncbi:MAG: hypothetical protein ACYDEB_12300 [Dehalococcoidia bacterium]